MSQMCPNCSCDNSDNAQTCADCSEPLRGLLGQDTMLEARYQLTRVLGCGGMGAVYLADDTRIPGRRVAVKENLNTSPQAQSQFQSEVSLMVGLNHPGLPDVSDQFTGPTSRQYLVMDYVEGETLEDVVDRRGSLPEAEVIALAEQLLNVLEHMHSRSVIHRDIKPSNIKLKPGGKPVLVDFGIAKLHAPGRPTQTWARGLGSPGFAPIEQYGTGTDARSDLYSLGAVTYYLLTGQAPPESPDLAAGTSRLTPPRKLRPDLSPHVQKVVFKAMAINPDQRFQSAAEMRQTLLTPASSAGDASPSAPPGKIMTPLLPSAGGLHWVAILGGAGIVLVGVALVLGLVLSSALRSTPAPVPVAGRAPTATPMPRLDSTATPVSVSVELTPTRTPTPGSTPKPTRTPTRTPTPTSTHTPRPTPTPTRIYTSTPVPPPSCPNSPRGEFRGLWLKYQSRLGCPHQTEPLTGRFAEQAFQGGHMFDYVDVKLVIVTFDQEGTWALFDDTWHEGESQESCTVTIPDGLYQPFWGFGRVWCNEPGVRDKLGWAIDLEYGFDPPIDLIQGFEGGVILRDSDGHTHHKAYVLFNDNNTFVRVPY